MVFNKWTEEEAAPSVSGRVLLRSSAGRGIENYGNAPPPTRAILVLTVCLVQVFGLGSLTDFCRKIDIRSKEHSADIREIRSEFIWPPSIDGNFNPTKHTKIRFTTQVLWLNRQPQKNVDSLFPSKHQPVAEMPCSIVYAVQFDVSENLYLHQRYLIHQFPAGSNSFGFNLSMEAF